MKLSLLMISLALSLSTYAQNWVYDFNEAKILAEQENKQILLVFSGSDWCAPCIKLDRQIWQTKVFKNHAKENLVLLKADFPKRKKNQLPKIQQDKNKALAETYNTKGYFPFVVLLDANGKVINQLGYKNLTPTKYIEAIYGQ
jgi:thioredoxin-related protein